MHMEFYPSAESLPKTLYTHSIRKRDAPSNIPAFDLQLNVVLIIPHFIHQAEKLVMDLMSCTPIFTLTSFKRVLIFSLPAG